MEASYKQSHNNNKAKIFSLQAKIYSQTSFE